SAAEASGALRIDVPARDPDVELSERGLRQAEALGRRLAAEPAPDAVRVSPYRRARATAEVALGTAGWDLPPRIDERLRDRELGLLDTFTGLGVRELHPGEAERRRFLGKFYYRPPGGESWVDVAFRIRSVLPELEASGERVLVVAHDAVIWLFRAVCERIEERELLDMAAATPIPNASITRLVHDGGDGPWRATVLNDVAHLDEVTEHGGRHDAPQG
ncbi:MAG TPA: histidine phosphatase family protein, partial [Amnibacterium sp.]